MGLSKGSELKSLSVTRKEKLGDEAFLKGKKGASCENNEEDCDNQGSNSEQGRGGDFEGSQTGAEKERRCSADRLHRKPGHGFKVGSDRVNQGVGEKSKSTRGDGRRPIKKDKHWMKDAGWEHEGGKKVLLGARGPSKPTWIREICGGESVPRIRTESVAERRGTFGQ